MSAAQIMSLTLCVELLLIGLALMLNAWRRAPKRVAIARRAKG